ncbi:MAG: ATP-dependent DNA helicase RecG [Pirellulales bacterium]
MTAPFNKTPAEILKTPLQYVRGVGSDRAEKLARLGLRTARDLAFFFPRAYEDMSEIRPIGQLADGVPASVIGVVSEIDLRNTGAGRSILGALIKQDQETLRAVYFNQPFMEKSFRRGGRVLVSGIPKRRGLSWEMTHPKVEVLGADEAPAGKILPVYALTEGLTQPAMRKLVAGVLDTHSPLLEENLPPELLDAHGIWPIHAAVTQMHQPRSKACLEAARRRFVFQELLVMQLALAMRRQRRLTGEKAPVMPTNDRIEERVRAVFPFEPTGDQRAAMREIAADLGRDVPMNRLLQGDVGTGKTLVAQYAMLLAVAHGYQAALMAPTEVLARQHARTLERSLAGSRVRIGLLTGSVPPSERRRLLERVAAGEVDLIVGTHAVVQAIARAQTQFARLGLVVIDEQHKFGVRQRATLKQAGLAPHYLVMTATPIPRTVSMTMFGDLDVSTIRQAPPGRQRVHTYLVDEHKRERWWEFFCKKLREGRQGYVIAPRVDDEPEEEEEPTLWEALGGERDDAGAAELRPIIVPPTSGTSLLMPPPTAEETAGPKRPPASVERLFEELSNGPLSDFKLDLVHGRMSAADKDDVMQRFHRGEVQVLVATSVVEVGIDVANATVMTIEDGNQFGLSQLHQLRGRVNRGVHPGYVGVFAEARTDESRERLAALAKTSDGFELAEADFRLRGPGDLFGTRQHGLPPLRVADLQRDGEVLAEARAAAQTLIAANPDLAGESWERLRRMVLARYGKALDLGDVG